MEKEQLFSYVETLATQLHDINAQIWATPELGFEEHESIKPLIGRLKQEGFTVEQGVAGLETAFVASWGNGGPIIGLLAEYDALPYLSQKAETTEKIEVEKNGNGHGCGHCCIGVGALGGALAIKQYLEHSGTPGTIRFYGCPGEEYGSGKVFMARAGLFDDLDACMTWHPSDFNGVMSFSTLAIKCLEYHFNGNSSHAASGPHLGRSGLDACELMNVGVNYLREHVIDEARIHYAYTEAGGKAPNVVQEHASLLYNIRAPKIKQVNELVERVNNVARGAALMTDTTLTIREMDGMCDMIVLESFDKIMHECLEEVGPPKYDQNDYALAKAFRELVPDSNKTGSFRRMTKLLSIDSEEQAEELTKKGLPDFYRPFRYSPDYILPGSTDVGDVSYIVPTTSFMLGTWVIGTLGHSWQSTALANSSISTKSIVCASKAFALVAKKLYENPDLINNIKEEHRKMTPNGYMCPISKDLKPTDL